MRRFVLASVLLVSQLPSLVGQFPAPNGGGGSRPYFEEMRYFVELGMTPMEAIVAATKNGGTIIGDQYRIGTLEPGKLADLHRYP
jgi:hypothetical protein